MPLTHPLAPCRGDADVPAAAPGPCTTLPPLEAPAQPDERFKQLLRDLSLEFDCLWQQNADLARENSELRATASGDGLRHLPPRQNGGRHGRRSLEEHCANGELARREPALSTPEAEHASLAPRRAAGASLSSASARRITGASLNSVMTRGFTGASLSSGIAYTPQEIFHCLDVKGSGRLHLEELMHIMNKAGEFVDYKGLLDLVRVLNGLDPISPQTADCNSLVNLQDEMKKSEDMSIDVYAFQRLMDKTVLHGHYGSDIEACISSVRRACRHTVSYPRANVISIPSSVPTHSSDERHTFWLETVPTMVILANTIVSGLTADHPGHQTAWDICEIVFAAFYTIEFVVKVHLYGCRGYWSGLQWMWNIFDFACLSVSLCDVALKIAMALMWDSGPGTSLRTLMMVKIFRLARLARLVRALRFKFFHELKLIVIGVFSGLRVLTWAIVLLVILTYTVGIVLTNLLGHDEAEFASVTSSMFTLFRCWTEGCAAYDGTPLSERIRKRHGPFFMVFHVLVTMFVTVGLFNLIMAIFIDNVMTSQNIRRHHELGERTGEMEMRFKRMLLSFIKDGEGVALKEAPKKTLFQIASREVSTLSGWRQKKTGRAWRRVNGDWEGLLQRNMTVTQEVFNSWLQDEDFQILLNDAEIETSNKFELFEVLDVDMSGELSMDELKTGLMKLRGPVTKADIVAMRLKVRNLTRILERLTPAAAEGVATGGKMTIRDNRIGTFSELGKD